MDKLKKETVMRKMKGFATLAGKLNALSSQAEAKKQENIENQNILNTEIEKGIAKEKFFNSLRRKNKTDADAKNIEEYEAIVKLFGKDTEQAQKQVLCKGMQLETFSKGQAIIKQNEPSNNKFYVITQGSVVIVKATDTNVFQVAKTEDQPAVPQGNQDPNTRNSIVQRDSIRPSITTLDMIAAKKDQRKSKLSIMKKVEEDVLQVEIQKYGKEINTLKEGQGFGDAAILESDPKKAKRGATILAREENTQLIIIMKREFQKFKETFSSQGKEKQVILTSLIPQLKFINSTQTRDDLIFYFQEEGGMRGQALTIEGKVGDKVYVLKEGSLQIEKNYVNEKNIYYHDVQKLKISSISDPAFIGEEIITDHEERVYNYTITISSITARFYTIKKSILMYKFPNLKQDILNEYELKEAHRRKTVEYILSKNAQPSNMISVGETLHEYNKLKNFDLFSQMKTSMVDIHNKNVFKGVQKQEKFQTAEDIAKIRKELRKEFIDNGDKKLTTENKSSSQTNLALPEEIGIQQQLQQLGNLRPQTGGVSRKQFTQVSMSSIGSMTQLPAFEEIKQQQPLRINTQGTIQPQSQKEQQLKVMIMDPQIENNNTLNQREQNLKQPLSQQIPLEPVYSQKYQEQHDLEDDFMENLPEKLKLMSKASQVPKDSPQLDLGYLESFKKKQNLKLKVHQKLTTKSPALFNSRMEIVQKKIDKIKNRYLKENHESEIIIQDGINIQNVNSNNIINSVVSRSQVENTPKSTLANYQNLTQESSGTPLSNQGVKAIRKSVQYMQSSPGQIKFSSFKTEGQTPSKSQMQQKGTISKIGSLQSGLAAQQLLSNSPINALLKNNYVIPQIQSVPSLFQLNSQRGEQSSNNNMSYTTPQQSKTVAQFNNQVKNITFSSFIQNQKIKSSGVISVHSKNNIDEFQETVDSQLSPRLSTNCLTTASPYRTKSNKLNLQPEKLSHSMEEKQHYYTMQSNLDTNRGSPQKDTEQYPITTTNNNNNNHNLYANNYFQSNNTQLLSAAQKLQKSMQVKSLTSAVGLSKELLFSSAILSPIEQSFKSHSFVNSNNRCQSSQDFKRKSIQRKKLKTGLSYIKKPQTTQVF